ncbi:DUF962 domain-containing protein [Marnyiella aurantia]|uniref:DUF962 domain-containing protein n=1 Tax=Marnyiella aurantia TaxID=2758037 RepID=A0A7D7LS72_9FLAO|nr:DUF962 domain-containing protein [Marnyiella aurantia]MBA5245988.1 DUF962 domain-containing protein [Marnyiella aurantia]QMS98618.1 DUF962 domain-containing protein [Marnyiella aurantia]
MGKQKMTYGEFYGYYLSQHQKPMNRVFHFLGIFFTFWILIYIIYSGQERFFWYLPLTLLALPAFGHVFEKNTPTGIKAPVRTLMSDFRFFFELISGKEKFRPKNDNIIR